jgi:hypothetical protein
VESILIDRRYHDTQRHRLVDVPHARLSGDERNGRRCEPILCKQSIPISYLQLITFLCFLLLS